MASMKPYLIYMPEIRYMINRFQLILQIFLEVINHFSIDDRAGITPVDGVVHIGKQEHIAQYAVSLQTRDVFHSVGHVDIVVGCTAHYQ